MLPALQVFSLLLVAVTMALALAHALELPGKRRLSKDQYLAVQPIYYPGFPIGGIAEPLAMLALIGLLVATPELDARFWLTAASFLALIAMHAAYWLLTHPVNNFWLKDFKLGRASAGFFGFGAGNVDRDSLDWTALRDRWERSHVVRAALGLSSFVLLACAVVTDAGG